MSLSVTNYTFLATIIGLFVSSVFLSSHLELAAAALITFSLRDRMLQMLEDNRRDVWEEGRSSYYANGSLASKFITLFCIIFFTAFVLYLVYLPSEIIDLTHRYQNPLQSLFINNLQVLIGFFIFAFIYRDAGLMFILSWNALHWASAISSIFSTFFQAQMFKAMIFVLSIFPHLVFEATSYILVGLAGVFLSKGFFKYAIHSDECHRVFKASLFIFLWALFSLVLAVLFEFFLAQQIYSILLA